MSKQKKLKIRELDGALINAEKLIDEISRFAEENGLEARDVDVVADGFQNTYSEDPDAFWIELQIWV